MLFISVVIAFFVLYWLKLLKKAKNNVYVAARRANSKFFLLKKVAWQESGLRVAKQVANFLAMFSPEPLATGLLIKKQCVCYVLHSRKNLYRLIEAIQLEMLKKAIKRHKVVYMQ